MIHLKKTVRTFTIFAIARNPPCLPSAVFLPRSSRGKSMDYPSEQRKKFQPKVIFVRDICGLSKLAPCKWTPLRLLANNSQHCWMLHVVCINCTPSCMLLGVVAQSLKSVKLLATWKRMQQAPNIVGPTINGGIEFSQLCPFARTVKPVLSGHPLLSGH